MRYNKRELPTISPQLDIGAWFIVVVDVALIEAEELYHLVPMPALEAMLPRQARQHPPALGSRSGTPPLLTELQVAVLTSKAAIQNAEIANTRALGPQTESDQS